MGDAMGNAVKPKVAHKYAGTIKPDVADVRDHTYRPALGILPERYLCPVADPNDAVVGGILTIRQQGARPSCIGEALAAAVDIQKIEALRRLDPKTVRAGFTPTSAAMLHAMAMEVESLDLGRSTQDIYSLRTGLKGFYNSGVCSENTWQQHHQPGTRRHLDFDSVSVEISREAHRSTLGAYYRVQSYINDYHSALIEAGALYVSAQLNGGWHDPQGGIIDQNAPRDPPADGHAFVIVGYDQTGFLVLNSWGDDWGGYPFAGGPPLPGIALWTYEDWSKNVTDAWVLRLAAPTPGSFLAARGQHGAAMYGPIAATHDAPSVRRMEVLGHYIHLDDGSHVERCAYPSSRQSLETTLEHLAQKADDQLADLRLTIHGDTMPTADLMKRVAEAIVGDKADGVHGISLIWANGLLSGAAEALKPLFDSALAVAKGNRDDADRKIEQVTRPVGRALWRDAHRSAAKASEVDGDARHAIGALVEFCGATGKRLHIVTEGAGILLLAALFRADGVEAAALADVLDSMTLVAPLITRQEFNDTVGRFLLTWQVGDDRRALILKPDKQLDDRLCVGTYSRSWTDLVSRAFEEKPGLLVGAHDFKGRLPSKPASKKLPAPDRPSGDLGSSAVLQHEKVRALTQVAVKVPHHRSARRNR